MCGYLLYMSVLSLHVCIVYAYMCSLCRWMRSLLVCVHFMRVCLLCTHVGTLYAYVCANCVCLFSHVSALPDCVYPLLMCMFSMCISVPFVNVWVPSMHICVLCSLCVCISLDVYSLSIRVFSMHMCVLCACVSVLLVETSEW